MIHHHRYQNSCCEPCHEKVIMGRLRAGDPDDKCCDSHRSKENCQCIFLSVCALCIFPEHIPESIPQQDQEHPDKKLHQRGKAPYLCISHQSEVLQQGCRNPKKQFLYCLSRLQQIDCIISSAAIQTGYQKSKYKTSHIGCGKITSTGQLLPEMSGFHE